MTQLLERPRKVAMAKKRKADTSTVRVELDVQSMIRKCAAMHDMDAPTWLSDLLRPILTEKLREFAKQIQAEYKSK